MQAPNDSNLVALTRAFLADFVAFAGCKGVWAGLAVAFGALLEGFSLVLIIPLLAIVIGSAPTSGAVHRMSSTLFNHLGATSTFGRLALLLGFFALLMVMRAVVISFRDVTLAELQIGFVEEQRSRIAARLATAPWSRVVALRHARITHLMSGDIQRLGSAAHAMLQCAIAIMMLAAQCVLAVILSPALAAIALALLAVGAVVLVPVLRRARDRGAFVTRTNLTLLNSTHQFLGGLKLAMSQNLQMRFVAEFRQTLGEMTGRQIAQIRQQTRSRLALTTLSAFVAAILVLLGVGVFHVAAPVLITLIVIVGRMSGPAGQIAQSAQSLVATLPAYEKLKELERELAVLPHDVCDGAGTVPQGAIAFENVSFHHSAEEGSREFERGVRRLNFTIAPGEFVGIVGPSGAGKTTLADLLVGLYTPQEGRITIGNIALNESTVAAWRDHVSYVSQDPFLFHDTIRRNLGWANPRADENDMWRALAEAGVAELVRASSEGLDTMVGERGTLVSGGERQRIALARALLRRPDLLLLDEATSAIDVAGERQFLERLCALTPRPTIVMIAHRAESLVLCDRLLFLRDGTLEPLPAAALRWAQ